MHIVEQADVELSAFNPAGSFLKVAHADQQFPLAHSELEHQTQSVVTLDIVYHLDNRPVVGRQVVEYHGAAGLYHRKPLP